MPIYEYLCSSCAHRFEVKQSIKDEPIKECVRCGKEVTKLISPPAIMFKGSGWYITDYSNKMKPGGSDTSEKPAASSADATKTPAASDSAGTGSTAPAAPATPAASSSTTTSSTGTTGSGTSSSGSSSSSST